MWDPEPVGLCAMVVRRTVVTAERTRDVVKIPINLRELAAP